MSTVNVLTGPAGSPAVNGALQYTVAQYHRMIDTGQLTENDRVELIEGRLVYKVSHNPSHDGTLYKAQKVLLRNVPAVWGVRVQSSITLSDSEPEPDIAVVREVADDYVSRHPGPNDVGVVIEVADSSLALDRNDKCRVYARAGISIYWIINLVDRHIEVYESPSGSTASPVYGQRTDYSIGDRVSIVLNGNSVGAVDVSDILP